MTTHPGDVSAAETWDAARTLGTTTLVGLVCGWFVVGVLSRLAMMLLAVLNPRVAGVTTDDGFAIGQFTLSGSANLMFLVGTLFGVAGAGLYVALRPLMIGPAWFRLLSISVGPAVVIGALLANDGGLDFRVLEPAWLAVSLFVALPAVYVVLLSVVAERLLAREQPVPTPLVVAGLAAWLVAFPALPLLLALGAGFVAHRRLHGTRLGDRLLTSPWVPWVPRAALVVVFAMGLADLVEDFRVLS